MYHFGDSFGGWVMKDPRKHFSHSSYFNIEDYELIVNDLMALRYICDMKGIRYADTSCFPGYPIFTRPSHEEYPTLFTQSYPLSYAIQLLAHEVIQKNPDRATNMFTAEGLNTHTDLLYRMWVALGGER